MKAIIHIWPNLTFETAEKYENFFHAIFVFQKQKQLWARFLFSNRLQPTIATPSLITFARFESYLKCLSLWIMISLQCVVPTVDTVHTTNVSMYCTFGSRQNTRLYWSYELHLDLSLLLWNMISSLCPVGSARCGQCPMPTLQMSQCTACFDQDKTQDCIIHINELHTSSIWPPGRSGCQTVRSTLCTCTLLY